METSAPLTSDTTQSVTMLQPYCSHCQGVKHLKVVGAPEALQCRSVKSEKSPRQEGRLVLLGESFRGLFLQGQVFTS